MITKKHGAYYAVIKYRDESGKYRRKWFRSGTNYRDAVKLEHKKRAEYEAGKPIVASTDMPTVKNFLAEWLDVSIKPPARAAGTYENYSLCVKKVLPHIGKQPLDKVTPIMLSKMYRECVSKDKLSVTYTRMIHRVLRSAFSAAVKWRLIDVNPCKLADVPAPTASPALALDKEQAVALLAQSESMSVQVNLIIALGMLCGLRDSEQCGLRWQDYNEATGELYIRHNLNIRYLNNIDKDLYEFYFPSGDRYLVLDTVKTASSQAKIIVPQYVAKLLKEQHHRYAKNRMQYGPAFKHHNFVICGDDGPPKHRRYIYATVQRVWRAYNHAHEEKPLPKLRAHDLRHTAATLLLEENVDIKYVSRQLRHSSTVITQNLYQHVTKTAESKTADAMDRLIAESK